MGVVIPFVGAVLVVAEAEVGFGVAVNPMMPTQT